MNRIKELREQHNMSQKDLAEVLFVEPHTISRYESEIIMPDIETFKIMAKHFGTSIDYIVGISDEPWPTVPVAEHQLDNDERALIYGYRKLDTLNRAKVDGFLSGLLSKE
jgi:transcriptional regulator with XRE-family HTH domain